MMRERVIAVLSAGQTFACPECGGVLKAPPTWPVRAPLVVLLCWGPPQPAMPWRPMEEMVEAHTVTLYLRQVVRWRGEPAEWVWTPSPLEGQLVDHPATRGWHGG